MSTRSGVDFVTIGESMVLLQPPQDGALAYAPLLQRSVGGAESNVALALSRLGRKTRWVSRLGNDPFGDIILRTLAGEGVDTSFVERDASAHTALYVREIKGYGEPTVYYYRRGSAASLLSAGDVRAEWMQDARHLHVTGITPALGAHTREAIEAAMRLARELGLSISFDPNLRRKLWDENTARETLLSLVPLCDIFLPGIEEVEFLLNESNAHLAGAAFLEMGASLVVIKLGAQGAVAFTKEARIEAPPYAVERVLDSVGAGDAFTAGVLSILLDENSLLDASDSTLQRALGRGNIMGALATQFRGDWEGLPKLQELQRIEAGKNLIAR
jgi:2-dehydro-3-deoxygluconokinase